MPMPRYLLTSFLFPLFPMVLASLVQAEEPKPVATANQATAALETPALNGNCPTGYLMQGGPVKGKPEINWRYAKQLYFFSSEEAMADFKVDPERYLPQFGGLCTMALGGPYRNRIPGDPDVSMLLGEKVYLFSSVRARNAYFEKPEEVIPRAENMFDLPVALGYCPVAYIEENKPVRGFRQFRVVVDGSVFHCASREAWSKFGADPDKYTIAYKGLCAHNLSRAQRYNADPEYFAVIDGTTYLFLNAEAREGFMASPTDGIKAADENWIKMVLAPKKR